MAHLILQLRDILEYSLSGNLPYSSQCKKYYAGPTTYMYKENESFKNYITEESISLSEAVDYAQKSKMVLTQAQTDKGLQRKEYFKSINESEVCPGVSYLDRKGNLSSTMSSSNSGGLEIPGGGLGPGVTYITNAEYFLTGPYHGQNSSGTCGAVAAQLLLSYNNYYNDRRIIQNNYLFDGEAGPNTCADPMRMTSWTLGTRGLKEDGSDDSNSYFHKVVGKIPASPTLEQQKTGMESLLNGRGTVDTGTSMATIKNEIDANRPLIINMRSDEYVGHAVVGYGYQTLGGSGTSEDGQFGYIVHYGWSPYENWTEYSNMWINQAWCYNWVRLVVPHTHSYGTTSGVFYEKGCTSCGHRKSEYPFNTTVNNGQVTITGINFTPNSELTIPSKINGNTVTKISANAFANCNTLQSVKVPNSVQEIGAGAFSGCSSLTSITLPFTGSKRTATGSASCLGYIFGTSSYTGGTATNQNGTIYFIPTTLSTVAITDSSSIKPNAFKNCSTLEEIVLPYGISSIGSSTFSGCSMLERINIPRTVTSIGVNTFLDCNKLSFLVIPYSVTSVGANAFPTDVKIEWIYNPSYTASTLGLVNNLRKVIVKTGVQSVGSNAFSNCSKLKEVEIHKSVSSIASNAFSGCDLDMLKWYYNSNYTAANLGSYFKSQLTHVEIPNDVTSVKASAFSGCTELENVLIHPSVGSIGANAFSGCNTENMAVTWYYNPNRTASELGIQGLLTNVSIRQDKITAIGDYAFSGCSKLRSVHFAYASKLTSIGAYAFQDCTNLRVFWIPENMVSVGEYAFSGCTSLWLLAILEGVTSIGEYAFQDCTSLSTLTIPKSVTNIYGSSNNEIISVNLNFADDNTEVNLDIPSSINGYTITTIGNSAFLNQTQLSQITIPISVTSIGNSAFYGCTSLSSISIPLNVTHIGVEAFSPSTVLSSFNVAARSNINLIVAEGTIATYRANGWTGFNEVELSATGPLVVKSGQLRGEVEIPAIFNNRVVTIIGDNGFANQSQLTGISILSVRSIGSNAFLNCPELETVHYCSAEGLVVAPDHSASYNNYYYTERSLNTSLDAGYTYSLSFDYSGLTASTDITNVFTSLGVGEDCFAVDLPVQKYFTASSGKQVIVFTPTATQLASSNKLWCRFIRTSTPQTVSINISNVEIEFGMKDISISAFNGCEKLSSPGLDYRLLDNTTNQYAVTGISGMAGIYCALSRTLFIPSITGDGKQIIQIDASAFANAEYLKWVFIQSGISTIGSKAFQKCYNLEKVDLSQTSVTRIEEYAFDSCKLGHFNYPSSLTYIGKYAFIRTGNHANVLPNSVTTIDNYAFAYRELSLGGIRLPNNLTSIGSYAFAHCGDFILTNIDGTALTTIGSYAFYNTRLNTTKTLPRTVKTIMSSAFRNSSFAENFTLSEWSQLEYIGASAFRNTGIEQIVLPMSVLTIGSYAFADNSNLTIYTGQVANSLPTGWVNSWNSSSRPVVWGCALSSGYVESFTKTQYNPSNRANNVINNPRRSGFTFGGWYTSSDYSGNQYMNMLSAPNGKLYAKWTANSSSCVAEGTLVTLVDGSQVAVEDLTGDENLLVWNMLTGQFDSAPMLFIDSDPYREYEIIHLYFSDGTEVKVIDEHAFWDFDLNKYVFMRNDAAQYIGHWYNKQTEDTDGNMIWTQVQLVDVEIYNEYTTVWSPVTYSHLCFYVNGMLSMPGATEGLINIFEVDSTTMQYDMDAYYADIEEYGLFTYEEFNELIPVPEVIFDAFNGQYLKVSIGKGLTTIEELEELVERYAEFFTAEEEIEEPDAEVEDDTTLEDNINEIIDTVVEYIVETISSCCGLEWLLGIFTI